MPQRLSLTLAALALVASSTHSPRPADAAPGDMYVTSDASNTVRQFNGTTGAFQTIFNSAFVASGNLGIHFGATNNRVFRGRDSAEKPRRFDCFPGRRALPNRNETK